MMSKNNLHTSKDYMVSGEEEIEIDEEEDESQKDNTQNFDLKFLDPLKKEEDSLELLMENFQSNEKYDELLKSFVVTIEEIYTIKDPKFRNMNMQSKLKNFVVNQQEDGEQIDPEIFFNSILEDYRYLNDYERKKKHRDGC